MVCLLGQTIKITGGNILCHIPGLAFLVEIMFMVVGLVINIPPRLQLVVGEELRWRGGERVYSIWLSSRYLFNGTFSYRLDDQQSQPDLLIDKA